MVTCSCYFGYIKEAIICNYRTIYLWLAASSLSWATQRRMVTLELVKRGKGRGNVYVHCPSIVFLQSRGMKSTGEMQSRGRLIWAKTRVKASSQDGLVLSHVWLFASAWTAAHQAPLSVEFSRQEYWSGLPCPSPGDLPDPGIKPISPVLQTDSLPTEPPGKPPYRFISSI